MNQETYRHLVSGHTSSLLASLLRVMLIVLSWPYSLVIRLRNGLYSAGLFRAHRVDALVISVGNLTTGGTGKTPLVVWLGRMINQKSKSKNQNWPVAVLTRGYKTQGRELSDEPAVLAARCPEVSIIVNPDRVVGAKQAIADHGAKVLILDDGFQHRRLARDVDIVTIDATLPFGYGRLLPAGLLREPHAGLRRAHAAVITRSDQVSKERLAEIERELRQINPDLILATSIHAPVNSVVQDGTEMGLGQLRGKRVYAFCGLGNPEAFFDTVRRVGSVLVAHQAFDDHHAYTSEDLHEIRALAAEQKAEYIVTTQKDWTKIAPLLPPQSDPPMACLAIEIEFVSGGEALTGLIDGVLDGKMPQLQKPGK